MALIGYARVSTEEQNLDLQRRALSDAGCEIIFEDDGFSAIDKNRPGFTSALNTMSKGDVCGVENGSGLSISQKCY